MKRSEIKRILNRNRGSKAELARRAGVGMTAISAWLRGGTSRNISDKAEIIARELVAREESDRLTRREANGLSARAVIEAIKVGDPAVEPIVEKLKKAPKQEE